MIQRFSHDVCLPSSNVDAVVATMLRSCIQLAAQALPTDCYHPKALTNCMLVVHFTSRPLNQQP
jgi:hypothetical protein